MSASPRPTPQSTLPTPLLQGDEMVVAVEGGVRRTNAPTDGVEVKGVWVSAEDLGRALVDLKLLQRSGRKKPPRFKGRGL